MKIHITDEGAEIKVPADEARFYKLYFESAGYIVCEVWPTHIIVQCSRAEYPEVKSVFYEAEERWKDIVKIQGIGKLAMWAAWNKCTFIWLNFTAIYHYRNSILEIQCNDRTALKEPCTAAAIKKAKRLYDKINS